MKIGVRHRLLTDEQAQRFVRVVSDLVLTSYPLACDSQIDDGAAGLFTHWTGHCQYCSDGLIKSLFTTRRQALEHAVFTDLTGATEVSGLCDQCHDELRVAGWEF